MVLTQDLATREQTPRGLRESLFLGLLEDVATNLLHCPWVKLRLSGAFILLLQCDWVSVNKSGLTQLALAKYRKWLFFLRNISLDNVLSVKLLLFS